MTKEELAAAKERILKDHAATGVDLWKARVLYLKSVLKGSDLSDEIRSARAGELRDTEAKLAAASAGTP